jgi:hypothetical protein
MKVLTVIILVLTAAWCAGNVILGAIAAPSIFHFAYEGHISRELAGSIFGRVLERWSFAVDVGFLPLIGALILMLAGALLHLKRVGLVLLCLIALGGITSGHLWSRYVLAQALATAPPIDPTMPFTDDQRETFNKLHKRSTTAFSTEAGLLLLLIIGCGIALSRQSAEIVTSARPTLP